MGNQVFNAQRRGFLQLAKYVGQTIAFNGIERTCVGTGIDRQLKNKDAGIEFRATPNADLLREDFKAMGIKFDDVVEVVISPEGEPREIVALTVRGIEDDPGDPIVHLSLRIQD